MGDIDADHFPGFTADRLDELSPPWMVRMFAPVDSNDTAPGLEMDDYDAAAEWLMSRKPWYLLDVDHDRPSPGDDITRAAFDAMDGAS